MKEFVFIYWDEFPEMSYSELKDNSLYGSLYSKELEKAKGNDNYNTNKSEEVLQIIP